MKTKGSGTDFSNYVDSQCCDKERSMNDDPNVNGRNIVPPPAPVSSSGTGKTKTVHTTKS